MPQLFSRPSAVYHSALFVKLSRPSLLAAAVCSWCACAVPSLPAAPTALTAVAMVSAFATPAGFEPAFYRAFVQNGHEAPDRLEPIRILRGPLRVYIQTHDQNGHAIDEATLAATQQVLVDTAWTWSGQTYGIAEVARGEGTREKQSGWITVKWSRAAPAGSCGRSTVGVDGGYIELNASGGCSCGMQTAVYPRLVRHELGHAMGYYHTDHEADVMYGRPFKSSGCDAQPSDRERRHARIAHADTR